MIEEEGHREREIEEGEIGEGREFDIIEIKRIIFELC